MSDHISGPRALADPIADITDVYAFPSPERPGHLVLVVNTLPFAQPTDPMSDGLVYRFRLRPVSVSAPDGVPRPQDVGEVVVDCVFSPPESANGAGQEGTCTTSSGASVSFSVNDERAASADGIRAFAGPRWDPFILDAPPRSGRSRPASWRSPTRARSFWTARTC